MRIDTHCHFGGSITPEFVSIATNIAVDEARRYMVAKRGESFNDFLNKFSILDSIKWTDELIRTSIIDVCKRFDAESLDYVFLDFSIDKYQIVGWSDVEAVTFIGKCFDEYSNNKVKLILSLKYESNRRKQLNYANLIYTDAIRYLAGIDLVGDESYYDHKFYKPIFDLWNDAGKLTRAHVGESQGPINITTAIRELRVTNVAHGFKILGNIDDIEYAKHHKVIFDTTITSNFLTGVIDDDAYHPLIDMHRAGLIVTIGSDDPVQCETTLDGEFNKAIGLGLTNDEAIAIAKNAELLISK